MIKRSPAFVRPNSRKGYYSPQVAATIMETMMMLGGYSENCYPAQQNQSATLEYSLAPLQTLTQALSSRAGSWLLVGRMANIRALDGSAFQLKDLVTVSSSIKKPGGESEVLAEELPVSLVFGSGEWQRCLFPVTYQFVNGRVYSVTNTSSYHVNVTLGFDLMWVAPDVIW